MNDIESEATLREFDTGKKVAVIRLNGYNINQTVSRGQMRSFYLQAGSIESAWKTAKPLVMCPTNGEAVIVRLAARPSTSESAGILEFIKATR